MKREISLADISDGRKYYANDMVKADCKGCKLCSSCCTNTSDTVVLDPFDVMQLSLATGMNFSALALQAITFKVQENLVLPTLHTKPNSDQCFFLNEQGRCLIHARRPGHCRMFPLGRVYERPNFYYILQVHECPVPNKQKVKVHKWFDLPCFKEYEAFVVEWHFFLEDVKDSLREADEAYAKNISLYLLRSFYATPFCEETFFETFSTRLSQAKEDLGLS